jgi:hypothetical protein
MADPVYTAKALALVPRYADGGTWCSGTPVGCWTPSPRQREPSRDDAPSGRRAASTPPAELIAPD